MSPAFPATNGLAQLSSRKNLFVRSPRFWTHLVDSHNRYEIFQDLERLDELRTTELVFGTRENALNWIINNQLGRRNLSPHGILGVIASKWVLSHL